MASQRFVLYFLLFCQISGIVIFLKGFFPLKKNSLGFSTRNENGLFRKFDRLIVVMIDALRADFVFGNGSYMTFTNALIANGDTYRFILICCLESPTLQHFEEGLQTLKILPGGRVDAFCNSGLVCVHPQYQADLVELSLNFNFQAITTGTIPGFIDVILNVDSKELSEDNLVTQMKRSNKTMVFYGDDTWIKLFPDHFVRHDGTTSFFVTDYTEVDNNVTRHVVPELNRNDWDAMILHYLGLDHIGHLAGPHSPLIRPKLVEMDKIIEMTYRTALKQDHERNSSTLMVLCGDHGMSDGGSHGGSSFAETTTPLVFMSSLYKPRRGKPYEMKRVSQIDLTPTLALSFGLSIPKNSIGSLIPDLLTKHSTKERLEALRMNAFQISDVYRSNTDNETVLDLDLAARLHEEWSKDYENKTGVGIDLDIRAEKISKFYYSGMRAMTQKLTKFMSSYDFYALYIGIWLLVQSLFGAVCFYLDLFPQDLSKFIGLHFPTLSVVFFMIASLTGGVHLHLCSSQTLGTSEVFCVPSVLSFSLSCVFILSTAFALLGFVSILINIVGSPTCLYWPCQINAATTIFLVLALLLHNVSLLSTSFIEEEHQTWYFMTTTYHLILLHKMYLERKNTSRLYFNDDQRSVDNSTLDAASSKRNIGRNKDRKEGVTGIPGVERTERYHGLEPAYIIVLLLVNRTLRGWNQTGIKWADQPDVGDWLVSPENKTLLSLLAIVSLLGIALGMWYKVLRNRRKLLAFVIFVAGEVCVYLYRAATGCVSLPWAVEAPAKDGIQFAQFAHLCVLMLVLISLFQLSYRRSNGSPLEALVDGYVLLITLLLRTHNIPLVALMLLQVHIHRKVIWERCTSNVEVILSAYFVGWFTYFAQGNSNSLATVDIGAGYIGLGQNYWPGFVALLASLATFSGPLFWMMQAVIFIQNKSDSNSRTTSGCGIRLTCAALLMIKSCNLTVCAILSWFSCYHLFVWSVFSPKLLYEGVVSLVFCMFVLIISTAVQV